MSNVAVLFMHRLDILNMPLHGITLIEASAGTGKTHALIIIYLRLLLNLGNKSAFSRPLTIKEILVVTFTQSATQLLHHRIRENIHQLRLDCIHGYSNNNLFSKLLSQIKNIDLAITQLSRAEKEIDQASIFTIHGFCQKILTQNTLELNMLFNTSILSDEINFYQQICTDFWRQQFYPLPLNIMRLIQEYWKNPDFLLRDVLPYIHGRNISNIDCANFTDEKKISITTYYAQILESIKYIKIQWNKHQDDIMKIIHSDDINHKIYSKKNITRWMNNINQWITQPTIDHTVPIALQRFKTTALMTYNICRKDFSIFFCDKIEELYQQLLFFKTLILNYAVHNIQYNLHFNKYTRSKITFNDLIDVLIENLINNKKNKLDCIIRKCFPIAIIDEFQDTDYKQYKIFHILYNNHPKNGLIFIGDPKQAIYSFRGADFHTYIKARKKINNKYNLYTNWRSSPNMVNAVNQLFQYTPDPFISQDIPFMPTVAADQNNMHRFLINNQSQTAMLFLLYTNEIITIDNYQRIMAQECATTVCNLLHKIHNKTAWLENKIYKRILQPSDITILVRNHKEASIIQSALSQLNIPTIFLSNHKNIFETTESYELLLLLQAVLIPNRNTIYAALTTIFFGLNISNLETINQNESKWEQKLSEFYEYRIIWKNYGILSMIQQIIFKYKISEKLLSIKRGEISLINILHLGELLQNTSQQLYNEHELMQWYISQLTLIYHDKYTLPSDQLLRCNNNYQVIKISTIHKSKGLEFPITFLPFIANFHYNFQRLYPNTINYSKHNIISDNNERLSEDLRLLYVAITRSIYHCCIGIAPITCKKNKKLITNNSDLHYSAIGYLIQQNTPGSSKILTQHLKKLSISSNGDIAFRVILQKKYFLTAPKIESTQCLSARIWNKLIIDVIPWTITSYSQLKSVDHLSKSSQIHEQLLDIGEKIFCYQDNSTYTPHTFPKGKVCGNFFHNLFENLDFQNPIDTQWLTQQIEIHNIDPIWTSTIQNWIYIIFNTPLNNKNLVLSKIIPQNKQTEFKFYLPIDIHVTSQKLNHLCKYYDPLSYKSSTLTFSNIQGMVQGFIDLVFYWNHKYYLLDYKTNWLGRNNDAYIRVNLEQTMIKHHYSLQYQLYTLALHRFLRHRILSYNYNKHFGGIYYLFIRGMDGTSSRNGIYFHRPSLVFINKLDNLFTKQ